MSNFDLTWSKLENISFLNNKMLELILFNFYLAHELFYKYFSYFFFWIWKPRNKKKKETQKIYYVYLFKIFSFNIDVSQEKRLKFWSLFFSL